MDSTEQVGPNRTYDRDTIRAFAHFYIPQDEDYAETLFAPIIQRAPSTFIQLVQSFKKNASAVISMASMPFKIASANYSNRLYHQFFMAESIRAMKAEFDDKSDEEKSEIASKKARERFSEAMKSDELRYKGGFVILGDLEGLLNEAEMIAAATELMRQCEALTWSILEVLANDLFICLLNVRPQLSEALLQDDRTKKRFQVRDMALPLSAYGYDLSQHMGDVLRESVRIDDVEVLRTVFDVLFPNNLDLAKLLRQAELWKLNQRRNLILHRRSIVDEIYLRNTGDTLPLGSELVISPKRFEEDLALVLRIGSSMFESIYA